MRVTDPIGGLVVSPVGSILTYNSPGADVVTLFELSGPKMAATPIQESEAVAVYVVYSIVSVDTATVCVGFEPEPSL